MLPELGLLLLVTAFCAALWQCISLFYKPQRIIKLGLLQIGCVFAAYCLLCYAFLTDDFSVQYVAHTSNSLLPWYYKITAVWGAHEGSLLLWITILNVWYLALHWWLRKQPVSTQMINYVFVLMGLLNAGLLWLLIKTSNPFARYMLNPPLDGADLNPILQDLAMIIHPPILYLGYVGTAAAFALTMAMLWENKFDQRWVALVRPWARAAWVFLSVGIILGSWWAYYELGWGGWWFWDPVENASFIPWLTLTALLHNFTIAARDQRFLRLGAILVSITFFGSIFGTFIVRSGLITSVHAFARDPERGKLILEFLVSILAITVVTYIWRWRDIEIRKSEHFKFSWAIVGNNVLLLWAAKMVFWGTILPLFYEAITRQQISVNYEFFNLMFLPVMLLTFCLMLTALLRPLSLLTVILSCMLLAGLLLYAWFAHIKLHAYCGVALGFCIFFANVLNKRNLMTLAHGGLAILIIGISISSSYELTVERSMRVGDKFELAGHELEFVTARNVEGPNYLGYQAQLLVDNTVPLLAERRVYLARELVTNEVGILANWRHDLYLVLGTEQANQSWGMRVHYKPAVRWIWGGAMLMVTATILALCQQLLRRRRISSEAANMVYGDA